MARNRRFCNWRWQRNLMRFKHILLGDPKFHYQLHNAMQHQYHYHLWYHKLTNRAEDVISFLAREASQHKHNRCNKFSKLFANRGNRKRLNQHMVHVLRSEDMEWDVDGYHKEHEYWT